MVDISYITSKFHYLGDGYSDYKMGPFQDLNDLCANIDAFDFFEGMVVVLLNEEPGNPGLYWFIDSKWERIPTSSADVQSVITALTERVEKVETSLQDQINALAGTNKKVEGLETRTQSLEDRIALISGGKPKVDVKSLEYVQNPETQQEELGVKISKAEGNMLVKKDDGLASIMMVIGDDVNTEIINK